MKCTALRGEPDALIDACIHLATIDDLHMQFDIVIIISTGNKRITSMHNKQVVVLAINYKEK